MSGMSPRPLADEAEDLLFALHAVADQAADILLRIGRQPGRAPDNRRGRGAAEQQIEALHIGGHVAVGREHHGGRPAHDMVAGEQGAVAVSAKQR